MNGSLKNTAVLFIDLINDFKFDGGTELVRHTEEILPNLKKLRDFAKKNKIPIIYINDHYGQWQADHRKLIDYCRNEKSKKVIDEMRPGSDDYFLIKPKHSAFFQTPLQTLLHELGINHLIMAGIAGDICILFTSKDAYMYQFDMHIPANCIASEEKQGNDYALYLMESVMKANIEPF